MASVLGMRTNSNEGNGIIELDIGSEIKYRKFSICEFCLSCYKTNENVLYFIEVTTVFKIIILFPTSHNNEPQ